MTSAQVLHLSAAHTQASASFSFVEYFHSVAVSVREAKVTGFSVPSGCTYAKTAKSIITCIWISPGVEKDQTKQVQNCPQGVA